VSRPRTQLGEINVPVCCGGVVVNAGDLIVADAEGIVVVPRTEAAVVAGHLEQRAKSHHAGEQAGVSRSSIFSGVFAAPGGVETDWDDPQRALRRDR